MTSAVGNWKPSYSVGNPMMDAQHKKLLALCVRAAECLEEDSEETNERFHAILLELETYAREHFHAEESLLRESGYPQLTEHMEEHARYLQQLRNLLTAAKGTAVDKVSLCLCLTDWWSCHILEVDMSYRSCIAKA